MPRKKSLSPSSQPSEKLESWLHSEAVAVLAEHLGRIADALEWHCKIEEQRLEREYPPQVERKPATIGTAKYPDPEKDQPEKGEIDEETLQALGPRERKLVEAKRLKEQKRRSTPATGHII